MKVFTLQILLCIVCSHSSAMLNYPVVRNAAAARGSSIWGLYLRQSNTHWQRNTRVQAPQLCRHFVTASSIFEVYSNRPARKPLTSSGVLQGESTTSRDFSSSDYCTDENEKFLSSIRNSMCQHIFPELSEPDNIDSNSAIVLLLGVSGGCDSIGLLHAMLSLMTSVEEDGKFLFTCPEGNGAESHFLCELHVAHFDHQQRGSQSDGDRVLVEELCRKYALPFHCFLWDEKGMESNDARPFSQEIARDWRRAELSNLLWNLSTKRRRSGTILTAHHKDDSNETLLLKLLRGAHISNLSGMEPFSQQIKDRKISFARPMLDITKDQIKYFLTSNGIEWREDASNLSNKYKRNRVRNELIPLLADIAGGEGILQKRMDNLVQQSQEIKEDLSCRAKEYLGADACPSRFVLPGIAEPLDLVQKQALYTWANKLMGGCVFSYEQLNRVCQQLSDYPDRKVWTVSIGGGWDIIRNGDALQLRGQVDLDEDGQSEFFAQTGNSLKLTWNAVESTTDGMQGSNTGCEASDDAIPIKIPANLNECADVEKLDFVLCNVDDYPKLKFSPPWRRDRSPIKLKAFLRGQKVPLHRRGEASIICWKGNSTVQAVAVFVESTQQDGTTSKWVVHSDFDASNEGKGVDLLLRINSAFS